MISLRFIVGFLLVTSVLSAIASPAPGRKGKAAQDGHVKMLAPQWSHFNDKHVDRRRPLLSQVELARRHSSGKSSHERDLEQRATAWVQQAEYSGKTFFDG